MYDDIQKEIDKMTRKGHDKVRSCRRSKVLLRRYYEEWSDKGLYIYFATFTFKDVEVFNRKRFADYIRRKCKINACLFADYGLKNGRFHLHGIIATRQLLDNQQDYFNEFGFTKFQETDVNSIHYIVKYSVKIEFENKTFRRLLVNLK